jgi:ATP-grasp domain, R2K clade family 3
VPISEFRTAAQAVASRYFTIDVTQRAEDGAWQIIELGDGQVAGLPARAETDQFYVDLARRLG